MSCTGKVFRAFLLYSMCSTCAVLVLAPKLFGYKLQLHRSLCCVCFVTMSGSSTTQGPTQEDMIRGVLISELRKMVDFHHANTNHIHQKYELLTRSEQMYKEHIYEIYPFHK